MVSIEKKYNIQIDLLNKRDVGLDKDIFFNKNDFETASIIAQIVRGEDIVDLTNVSAQVTVRKANDCKVLDNCQILEQENGLVKINFTKPMLDTPGLSSFQLSLMSDSEMVTTNNFYYVVSTPIVDDIDLKDTDEYPILLKLQKDANEIVNNAKEIIYRSEKLEITNTNNETNREKEEDKRKVNESERISAENNRIESEINRNNKEAERISNENERLNSDKKRDEIYQTLCSSYNTLMSNLNTFEEKESIIEKEESKRVQNEINRTNEELKRVASEYDRIDNEAYRLVKETERVNSEEQRIHKENERIELESKRQSNESQRIEKFKEIEINEEVRKENEKARVSEFEDIKKSEKARIESENTRINNEEARKSEELKRVENEQKRQQTYKEALSCYDLLKTSVNESKIIKIMNDKATKEELNKLYKSAIITEDNKLKLIKNNDVVEELPLPKGFSGNYSDLNGIPSDLVNISTLDNKLSSKADKVELEKYQPKGNYTSDDDFSYLEEEIEKLREDTDDLLSNFISAGRFVSDISFEDGKLAIQTFPITTKNFVNQPKKIELDLPRYNYSDLIDVPKDLVKNSVLEEKLEQKADKSILNNYVQKEQADKDYMPNTFVDDGKTYTWCFRTVNGSPQIVVKEVE